MEMYSDGLWSTDSLSEFLQRPIHTFSILLKTVITTATTTTTFLLKLKKEVNLSTQRQKEKASDRNFQLSTTKFPWIHSTLCSTTVPGGQTSCLLLCASVSGFISECYPWSVLSMTCSISYSQGNPPHQHSNLLKSIHLPIKCSPSTQPISVILSILNAFQSFISILERTEFIHCLHSVNLLSPSVSSKQKRRQRVPPWDHCLD